MYCTQIISPSYENQIFKHSLANKRREHRDADVFRETQMHQLYLLVI